jgi:hypothetical protein
MLSKLLGFLGLLVLVGLLVQTMITTYYLGKIDKGLRSSLQSTENLLAIQQSIVSKNEKLQEVIATTKAMDGQLTATLQATQSVHRNISEINRLNRSTLDINQNMLVLSNSSGQGLQGIAAGMGQLKKSTGDLLQSLTGLSKWVGQDHGNLTKMRDYTESMNQRLPLPALSNGQLLPNLPGVPKLPIQLPLPGVGQ